MRALEGIRVVDLTRAMAGPFCTMILADLGADVIKIERPDVGDESRGWGPPFVGQPTNRAPGESAYFISTNRNKRSVTLDLKSNEGIDIMHRMISKSDVLVENFRTGVLDKLGLGFEDVRTINPMLIYCSISGYGRTGPYAERPGYDVIIQAEGGMMSITGPVEGPPSRVGVPIVDIASGIFAATSILASLHARDRLGEGQHIDVSLFDTQIVLLANVASNYLLSGNEPQRMGNAHPNMAPYEAFLARDCWFVLGVANEMQWERFCKVINRIDLKDDERFCTNGNRVVNRSELIRILNEIMITRDASEWLDDFQEAGVPCGPVNDVSAVFNHTQVNPRDLIIEIDHPSAGSLRLTGFPYKFSATSTALYRPPPLLGEHTEEVLIKLLGYSAEEVEEFRAHSAV